MTTLSTAQKFVSALPPEHVKRTDVIVDSLEPPESWYAASAHSAPWLSGPA
eukprot:CAMPEP_0171937616 /NCGR_PEP_ID=MMETSP0993-20121228/34758_1 /TAXON_ID=483369 /ORGANISM="non described non described, Strain CCMP2098" /LENGTH=50 /DNA_ID=CAMNT_0012578999 /DNA_START=169 /DNA_END=321 /DNA_ORIENTATION=-